MQKILKQLNITKKEKCFIFWVSITAVILTGLPYLYAYLIADTDKIYNGLHILTPGDFHVYFSYLEQVKQGNYFFSNLFTGESTISVFNIFWLLAGLFGKLFNINNILTFQLLRTILIPICLFAIYLFIAYIFKSKKIRIISFLFLLFSSGFGALSIMLLSGYINNVSLFYWPMDLWVPEYNLFLTLYHSPHLIASLTLIVLIFLYFLKAIHENVYKYSAISGVCGLILIQFHPFHLPTIFLVPTFYIIGLTIKSLKINWQHFKHLILFGLLTSPSVLYYFWLLNIDWSIKLKSLQNTCFSPVFFVGLISYGGLLIGLYTAFWFIIKKYGKNQYSTETNKIFFLSIWAITQFFLIYTPFNFQRRLTEGLQIPLVLLVIYLFIYIRNKYRSLREIKIIFNTFLLLVIFIFGFTISNWFVIKLDIDHFKENYDLFYFTNRQLQSYNWIKNNTNTNEIILSDVINGNYIAGVAGRRVYIGHVHVETLYFDNKLFNMKWFFKNNSNDEYKQKFLEQNNIKYIYFSKQENDYGNFKPQDKHYLKEVFSNSDIKIYRINYDTI